MEFQLKPVEFERKSAVGFGELLSLSIGSWPWRWKNEHDDGQCPSISASYRCDARVVKPVTSGADGPAAAAETLARRTRSLPRIARPRIARLGRQSTAARQKSEICSLSVVQLLYFGASRPRGRRRREGGAFAVGWTADGFTRSRRSFWDR